MGAQGDFEWGMRAGLLEDCVFIPDTLASWRVHPQQATSNTESSATRRQMVAMARVAFGRARQHAGAQLGHWPINRLLRFYREQIIFFGLLEAGSRRRRAVFLVREILRGNTRAWGYVFDRRRKHRFQEPAQFTALRELREQLNVPAPQFL
jgi:hypothetical protein